jgi:plastocyanin
VTEVKNKFDSGLLQAGTEWQHTFEEAGQFDYYCMLHPWMKGFVVIE